MHFKKHQLIKRLAEYTFDVQKKNFRYNTLFKAFDYNLSVDKGTKICSEEFCRLFVYEKDKCLLHLEGSK